jgi:hypothetical protein
VELNDLLDDLAATTKQEFVSMPAVVDGMDDLDVCAGQRVTATGAGWGHRR